MRKKFNLIVVGLIVISVCGTCLPNVSAGGERTAAEFSYFDPLVIEDAYYCDLDNDGLSDDCVTVFTLYSLTGLEADMKIDLKLSILLPSGQLFYFMYRITETFESLELVIEWYNVALEDGWYIFTVSANIHGTDIEGTKFNYIETESVEFDPRESQGGASPFAIVRY